jgi:hypothetical protein
LPVPIKSIFKQILLFKLKFSNVDSRYLENSKSPSNSNILGFGEVKQIINTPTVITMLVKRAETKQRILLDLMHEYNHLLLMIDSNEIDIVKY